ncbi:MAG: metallophosphoesterase [Desulfurococcales archaeon]|nr:metallophosphoesterase [Desulfurococcales archaeon]
MTVRVQIGHLADLHIGATRWRIQEVAEDVREALEESFEILEKEHVKTVLISGDIFDEPSPGNTHVIWAINFFRRLVRDKGFEIVVIPGDHDVPGGRDETAVDLLYAALSDITGGRFISPPTLYKWNGRKSLNDLVVRVGGSPGVTVAALPYVREFRDRRQKTYRTLLNKLKALLHSVPGPKVLMAHFGLEGFTHPLDATLQPQDIPGVFDYAAMGHIHKFILDASQSEAIIAYPNSLVPLALSETRSRERGPLIVDLSGDVPHVQQIRLTRQRIHHVLESDIYSLPENLRRALMGTPRHGEKKPIVHVILQVGETLPAGKKLPKLIDELEKTFNVIIRIAKRKRVTSQGGAIVLDTEKNATPREVEIAVLKSLLKKSGEHADKVAGLLLQLKEAVLNLEGQDLEREVDRIAEELLKPEYASYLGLKPDRKGTLEGWLG